VCSVCACVLCYQMADTGSDDGAGSKAALLSVVNIVSLLLKYWSLCMVHAAVSMYDTIRRLLSLSWIARKQ